jgi:hypothetical protein
MPYLQTLANFSSLPLALGEKMREYCDLSTEAHDDPRRIIRALAIATMAAVAYLLA